MRVLFAKFNCPSFICFCKPSPSLYTPSPLRLENTPHVPHHATISNDSSSSSVDHHGETNGSSSIEAEEVRIDVNGKQSDDQNCLRSNLKKRGDSGSGEAEKKRVQWIDVEGKELVEIREFEASETEDGDSDDQHNRSCVCVIL